MRFAGRIEPGRGSGASTGHVGGGVAGLGGLAAGVFFAGFVLVALGFRDRDESGPCADARSAPTKSIASAATPKRARRQSRRGVIGRSAGRVGWVGRLASIGM